MTKSRCQKCEKKLGVMGFECKCKKQFCIAHLQPQEHACTFDYRAQEKKVIQAIMDSEPRVSHFERID